MRIGQGEALHDGCNQANGPTSADPAPAPGVTDWVPDGCGCAESVSPGGGGTQRLIPKECGSVEK
ncbi:hypothetical protein MICRO8M_50127 [Microbacterium sp. 8M]|nr:hypothetical protein MICRO8M_50127 [Microbacterium sp. 8M]